jgi:hypothetical protein
MQQKQTKNTFLQTTDDEINNKYERGECRILTEIGREKLPNFVDSLENINYIDSRPFSQRRKHWDDIKKSKLIESFLINIPVPPIILYEEDYNQYKVIDGQQRIIAIQEFYNNRLRLQGLEVWSELNGRTYQDLPVKIKAGINHRSISTVTLITTDAITPEVAIVIKRLAFERISAGRVDLIYKEIAK